MKEFDPSTAFAGSRSPQLRDTKAVIHRILALSSHTQGLLGWNACTDNRPSNERVMSAGADETPSNPSNGDHGLCGSFDEQKAQYSSPVME